MCDRYGFPAKQAAVMRASRFEPPYPEEENHPVPRDIFPTGKKTARYGLIVRRSTQGNRPLEPVEMEWGFPTQVPSKRDPAVKLDKYVTNARNLASSMWRPSIASADCRCLVPFTHFAEPHPEGGMGDDGKPREMWFSIPNEPIAFLPGYGRRPGAAMPMRSSRRHPTRSSRRGIPRRCRRSFIPATSRHGSTARTTSRWRWFGRTPAQ